MKRLLALMGMILAACVVWGQGPATADKAAKVPEKKWFSDWKGYLEAVELQKQTGADILVYFAQYAPDDRQGLSLWFERGLLQHGDVVDGLRPYLKVKVLLPLNKKGESTFEKFRVSKGPVLYVVQTNGWRNWVAPFDWPNNKPELKKPAALLDEIQSRSDLRCQTSEDTK